MFTQAAFTHVASICKRTSFEFKKQFLFRAHTPLQGRRAARRSKLSRCSLITCRLARETQTSRARARVCEDIPKQARNILMFSSALRGTSFWTNGSNTMFRSMMLSMLSIIRGELCRKKKKKEQAKLFMVPQKCEKYENGADVLV